ncbi:FG-GAP-like repeat-containing protein [Hymenobacter sp. UYCo722]|uniref:FG-GAP-like repeat-containing protein n=1 Tax=Hymenobacter sp. UYCo722 TaxID=3156335 RepID=UPI0033995A92
MQHSSSARFCLFIRSLNLSQLAYQALVLALATTLLVGPARAQTTILSRQPGRNAVAAGRAVPVSIVFSQAIAPGTAAGLRVYGSALRGLRPGTLAGGGSNTLTFSPAQGFAPGESVSVSVPSSLTSTGGAAVTRQVYQFTAATGGPGRGFFLDTAVVGNTTSRDQLLADMDNDGDLDLITTGGLYGCRVFANDGAGHFSFLSGVVAAQEPAGVALADVNQDGFLDALVADFAGATVAVCLNDGHGTLIGITGTLTSPIPSQNVVVGTQPVGVAAGDLDGDGDQDFVTANAGDNTVSIWFNNGSYPAFYSSRATVAMGSTPSDVALADVDSDGDLDLLVTNSGSVATPASSVSVRLNAGNGTFGPLVAVAVGLRPSALALADVDSDGDLDLLTANAGAASVSLRLNNGSGSFAGSTTLALPAGSTPSGLRTGDVDADGDLDLVVAQGVGGRVFTYLNTAGTFAVQRRALHLSHSPSPTATATGVTLGDIDGDGDLDLVTYDDFHTVLLSRNEGPPPALAPAAVASLLPAFGPVGTSVIIAGTGLVDVVAVLFNNTPATGFTANAGGTSLTVAVPAGASSGLVTVVTEDAGSATSPAPFTVTTPVEVLLTSINPARNAPSAARSTAVTATFSAPITAATAGNLRVFGSQRGGRRTGTVTGGGTATLTFTPDQEFAPGELVSVSLPATMASPVLGNVVRPQVVQFVAATGGTGRHDFALNTALSATLGTGTVANAKAGDFDNDGDLDLALLYGTSISIRLNSGTGTFGTGPTLTLRGSTAVLALADVDADGDLDLVSGSTATTVWLNDGHAAFTALAQPGLDDVARTGMELVDFDADGLPDLLSIASNSVKTYRNLGGGSFSSTSSTISYLERTVATAGDVNNDGRPDVIVAGTNSPQGRQELLVLLNDGQGQFTSSQQLLLRDMRDLALGDLDGDGDLDLVYNAYPSFRSEITILRNDGRGSFGPPSPSLYLDGRGLTLADADADGDLDVLTYHGLGVNDGAGNYTLVATPSSQAFSERLLAVGDFDGDLDVDLLTRSDAGLAQLLLNRPGPPPVLSTLTPDNGPVGSRVLLTGRNLTPATGITFNGVAATAFAIVSLTQLAVTVPAGATSGPVVVTSVAGTAQAPTPFMVTRLLGVTGLNPARNAANAPANGGLGVQFARAVNAGTADSLRVFGRYYQGRVVGTVAGGGTAALAFTPTQAFGPGETVSVSIPATIAGTDGSRAGRQTYQFTTAAAGTGTGLLLRAPNGLSVAATYSLHGFAVGDLDDDGTPDLLTTYGSIRYNNTAGAFLDSLDSPIFSTLAANNVALADLNGDGRLDALSTDGTVQLNLGNATFDPQSDLRGYGDDIHDFATGDLDGDGDLDLVGVNYARDSVYVDFNDGTGRFPTRLRVAVGAQPNSVVLGDVDNDGDLDFVVAGTGGTVSIGFNEGTGWFAPVQSLAAGAGLRRAVLGDLDGDHDLDLATNNGRVYRNDGTGTFALYQTTSTGNDLALADVDADGDLDLLVAGTGAVQLRRNDGTGQLAGTESISFGTGSQNTSPILVDLDHDGDLDLLVANATDGTINVALNQRVAAPALLSFAPALGAVGSTVVLTGTDLIGTTSVTFNGVAAPIFTVVAATRLEVVVPAGATSGVVRVQNPVGSSTSATAFTVVQTLGIASLNPARNATVARTAPITVSFAQAVSTNTAANLVVVGQSSGRLAGRRAGAGTSTLSFTPTRPYAPGEILDISVPPYVEANQLQVQPQVFQLRAAVGGTGRGVFDAPRIVTDEARNKPVVGDVDGDGDLDEIHHGSLHIELLRNNGNATFGPPEHLLASDVNAYHVLALGDVDGDGDLDLAIGDVLTGTGKSVVYIRLNDGAGHFATALPDVAVGEYVFQLAFGDLDADGDLDLITGNGGQAASTISVRLNDGSGHFRYTRDERFDFSGISPSFSLGDLDSDGDLDLVTYTNFGQDLRFNDGHGGFATVGQAPNAGLHPSAQALGDMDGDGDLDLVVTLLDGEIETFFNNGNGTFAAPIVGGVPNGAEYMMLGDLDADGDLDAVVMGYDSNYQVAMNDGKGALLYAYEVSLRTNSTIPACSLNDFDGDGDLDLLYFYRRSNTLRLALNAFSLATASARPATAAVALYPNPAHEQFRLVVPAALRPATATALPLRLYNALGQLVRTQPVSLSASGEAVVHVGQLPAGLYTLHVGLQSGPVVLRVAIE